MVNISDLESTGNEELCKICMDAPMECVMLECGHIATCVQCGKRLNECPICRQYVVRVVRFFRSWYFCFLKLEILFDSIRNVPQKPPVSNEKKMFKNYMYILVQSNVSILNASLCSFCY